MPTIIIEAGEHVVYDVNLVGVPYKVKQPKSMLAINLATEMGGMADNPEKAKELLSYLENWLLPAFGKKQTASVMARLQDPEDDLDLKHILQLMEKITEAATPDPTT